MWEVFHSVPKMRAMAVDAASYEEMQALYHGGSEYRNTLWQLVCAFNRGTIHPTVADMMGDLFLIGIEKRDEEGNVVGTRPIGIPAALRRLAGRVLMAAYSEEMGKFFTTTPVPPEMLVAAGHAPDRRCHVPQQLGVGVKGGAEIIVAGTRVHLGMNPGHAVASDDKKNGFNTMSRRAIFRGLRRWFPELIPTVRLWYARRGNLFTFGELATDADGRAYYSEEGCAQGDPLGPFLWSIGYHEALLEQQAHHPDTLVYAYLDDTYALDAPAEAAACMDTGAQVTLAVCNVSSNLSKQCIWSPGGAQALAPLAPRTTLRGTPDAPPQPEKGYLGGVLPGIRVLGAFLGEDEWCSLQLCKRVRIALAPLEGICQLEDAPNLETAQQAQQCLLRFCSNATVGYFLRTMPPSVTIDAARLHDRLIAGAFHRIVASQSGSHTQRERALRQARLPVKLGGMGLTCQERIRPAAWVGTWALVWTPLCKLHAPFKEADITALSTSTFTQLPIFTELQDAHASLLARHARVEGTYDTYDRRVYDFCKEGLAHFRFHPQGLPDRDTLLPLAQFASGKEHLQNAQRRFSLIIHHAAWLDFWNELGSPGVARRESVRFVAVSQPHAGDILNAIPMRRGFRVPSWAMRIVVQRRLGLPLDAALSRSTRDGKPHDAMGDAASNVGRAGHNQRHREVLDCLVRIMRSVWGNLVEKEPADHLDYSNDYRPDASVRGVGRAGKRLVGDTKFKDPLSSNPDLVQERGGLVGFGNTEPGTRADMYGLEERGVKADGNFNPRTGGGYVRAKRADYQHALSRSDTDVQMWLFETFGGWSAPVVALFRKMSDKVSGKLSKKQYDDEVSWSTRTWLSLQAQRLSVALHLAAAWEIAVELGLQVSESGALSPDDGEGGADA